MSIDLLTQLTALMKEADLNTVDLRDGDQRVVLKRGPAVFSGPVGVATHYAPAASSPPAAPQTSTPKTDPAGTTDAGTITITSPMVGTFYSKPTPDAKPFVAVGTVVTEDTDVCIIEAMKVFNNIKAETRGTVTKVCVNDGQTVEFGQALFLLKPN